MTKQEVIELAGGHLQLDGLAFDDLGFCALQLDDTKLLLLYWDEEQNRLGLNAELGSTDGSDGMGVMKAALSYNLIAAPRNQPVCGLDDDTSSLFLIWSIPAADADQVAGGLQTFFDSYHECLGRVASHEHATKLMEGDDAPTLEDLEHNLIKA